MVEFESVFQGEEEGGPEKRLADIEQQLASVTPLGISSEVVRTVKRLTRKTYVGDGSTGDANFDGSSAVTGTTRSGTTYTLTQDCQYDNVTVASGVTVVGRQFLFFVKGNLTNNGTIYANGGWW